MTLAALLLATCSATLPMQLIPGPGSCHGDSIAHSYMRLEVWFQARATPWPPPDWRTWAPHYAPVFLAASRDSGRGCRVSVTIPDALPHGTLIPRARGPGGLSCDGNYVDSRRTE